VAALDAEPRLRDEEHPVDSYVERTVRTRLGNLGSRFELRFAHEPPPRRVAMQRLAELSGFAPLSPGRLVAHPVYGPWIALRAVVVLDLEGPTGSTPGATAPCLGCSAPCLPALEQALAEADPRSDHAVLHERWRPWLAVRDACPVGREHRYSEPQIVYHYARRWI
jgi:methylmalonic aciduria homocystinuria type C protein